MAPHSRSPPPALGPSSRSSTISSSSSSEYEKLAIASPSGSPPRNETQLMPLLRKVDLLILRILLVSASSTGLFYIVTRWRSVAMCRGCWPIIPLLLCETLCFIPILCFMYTYWFPAIRIGRDLRAWLQDPELWPTVDVFIPCYTEHPDIVRETLVATMHMDYPPEKLNVYLLDDGNRADMKHMFDGVRAQSTSGREPGVHYIARIKPPGQPHHGKAGNLNHALLSAGTAGRFVVVFDCDMICRPCFLLRTLGHFYKTTAIKGGCRVDETVSYVQTPQEFYNVAPRDPLSQRQAYFYDFTMHCWAGRGLSLCCGTNVVFSRQALTSIGGWGLRSATEDVLTSYLLNAAGYRGLYVWERLAFGVNPTCVKDFVEQRMRWMAGSLQILLEDFPLFKHGLTVGERIYYLAGFGVHVQGGPAVLIYLANLLMLLTPGLVLCKLTFYDWLFAAGPYLTAVALVHWFTICKSGVGLRYIPKVRAEAVYLSWMQFVALLKVVLGMQARTFMPTPKGVASSPVAMDLVTASPQIMLSGLGVMSLVIWLGRLARGELPMDTESVVRYVWTVSGIAIDACLMAYPVCEALWGFGDEAHRTYDDWCKSPEGQRLLGASANSHSAVCIHVNPKDR